MVGEDKKYDFYIGLDPGLSGAIGIVDHAGRSILSSDFPTIKVGKRKELHLSHLVNLIKPYSKRSKVILEKVNSRPGQGVVSVFSFGRSFGMLEGCIATLKTPYELVTPQRWMKSMLADVEGTDTKGRAILAASRLWPEMDFSRKKDHNRASALLLGEYGRRMEGVAK